MPFSGRDAVVLCLLIACVPFQLWLSSKSSLTANERDVEVLRLLRGAKNIYNKIFSLNPWKEFILSLIKKYFIGDVDYSHWFKLDLKDELGVCPAVEVWNLRNPQGYFGMSPQPRSYRLPEVKFRVGQVVKHLRWKYHGVIIGWDLTCKAPDEWIQNNHGDKKGWKHQPNYALLVDTNYKGEPEITYVPQENVIAVKNKEIKHNEIEEYFEMFDGAQYIPHKWLRAVYPLD